MLRTFSYWSRLRRTCALPEPRVAAPATIAVAGFGDFAIAAETQPTRTTVRFPHDEMGIVTARLIAQRLSDEKGAEPVRDLRFELVFRQSA